MLAHSRPEGSTARFEGDAAHGTLKAYAQAFPAFDSGQEAWARGWVSDQYTLHAEAADTPLHITLTYTIDGMLRGGASDAGELAAFNNAAVLTQFVAGTGNLKHEQWARTEAEMGDCWADGCAGFAVPIHWVDQIEMDVLAEQPFDIYYALDARGGWAYGGSAGTADFESTGALSFTLPAGTWLTSLGGFSQAGATSPIPLPAALPLFLSGLAGVGLLARRRKKPAA